VQRIYGGRVWGALHWGWGRKCVLLGVSKCVGYFGAFFGPFEYLLMHCNISRYRPLVCQVSLTFQADCGSKSKA